MAGDHRPGFVDYAEQYGRASRGAGSLLAKFIRAGRDIGQSRRLWPEGGSTRSGPVPVPSPTPLAQDEGACLLLPLPLREGIGGRARNVSSPLRSTPHRLIR